MIKPDFLIKPYEVHSHKGLRPSDGDIYAVVYWLERLRDGKCTASNETIGEIACIQERTVRAGLERLEKYGFIKRVYEVDSTQAAGSMNRNRVEIRTMVRFAKVDDTNPIYVSKSKKVKKMDFEPGAIVPVDEVEGDKAPKKPTPADEAKEFFRPDGAVRSMIVDEIASRTGAPREAVVSEMKKFFTYWTEPNKSGTKVRWEGEKYFDVRRRIATWLSRAGKFQGTNRKGAGAGATI